MFNFILLILVFSVATIPPTTHPTRPAVQPIQPAAKPAVQPIQPAKPFKRIYVLIPHKERDFVLPENVGVPNDCPFPTVRKPIKFVCPCCGLWMQTHLLYHHFPQCPNDGCIMKEEN